MCGMTLGEPIAESGNLYAWGESQILKIYSDEAPPDFPEYMNRLDSALYQAGLSVPEVGEIVEVNNKRGHAVYNKSTQDRVHLIFECYSMDDYGKGE